jgi:aminoglycoside 6'-N-acetyltransferase
VSSSPRSGPVALRPLIEADLPRLAEYARDPSVLEWWGAWDDPAKEFMDPGETTFAIEVGGELAGWLGAWEENESRYRHGGLDLFLGRPFQDRAYGSAALRLGARWLFGVRGHHRITIDPAARNTRAIRCYEAVGFRPVGITRASELALDGTWQDGLLMDLLAGELREADGPGE